MPLMGDSAMEGFKRVLLREPQWSELFGNFIEMETNVSKSEITKKEQHNHHCNS